MIDLIIDDLLKKIKVKKFPTKIYINYGDYKRLLIDLERDSVDSVFMLRVVIVKSNKFKLV